MTSIWLSWFLIAVLFFIAEIFFLSGDFFALGIAALITSIIFKFLSFYIGNYNIYIISSIVFLVSAIISWFITKFFVKKLQKDKSTKVFTNEEIIGQHLIVQQVDGKKVAYYQGIYWPIKNFNEVSPGDQIEVISFEDNQIIVKKL